MKRIAYIGPTGVFGGVRVIHEHLTRLAQRGHDVTLIYTDPQPLTWLPAQYPQRPLRDPGYGYDVVVGTAITTWPLARQIAGAGMTAGLLQMAEWLFWPIGHPQRTQVMQAWQTELDTVMAISEWLAHLAEPQHRRVERIRNGIDTRMWYREPFPDLPSFGGITLAVEGVSANPAKDIDEMTLRAVRRLRYDHGVPLRVLGFSQHPQPSEIYDRYWQLPPQQVIRMIYGSADIFLKASRYEGRPGPDMEAMACGAVVCRAILLGDDDLIHGQNCLKTRYGDIDEYVNNLRALIDDPALRERLRAQALEYVRTRYDWDGAIDLVEHALTGAVTPPPAQTSGRDYDLSLYDPLQEEITYWETGQATWLADMLLDLLHPRSVIDIGCGPGNYIAPMKPGVRVLGVDGAPAAGRMLDAHEFVRADLRTDWAPQERYDLSLCIETAEHLPPDRAEYLVDLITGYSDACFWSAARPGQGGQMHLNERPREYWLALFASRGWGLHPRDAELQAAIRANPHCQRVGWLIGNSMLLVRQIRRVRDDGET